MTDQQLPSAVAWAPEDADRILLAAHEHELATVRLLLATLDAKARGTVFIEVESAADIVEIGAPPRFEVRFLLRDRGQELGRAVDAWCEEWLTYSDCAAVYAWVAGRGPARVLTAD
ncbi:MAG TPA: SIP domain-containing protein [Microbacteriaceae bacterium]|nr:SIP domain-containing protein [Microbacteriaceae bacterium]